MLSKGERERLYRENAHLSDDYSHAVCSLLRDLEAKDAEIECLRERLRWIADHDGGPERDGLFHDWEWGNEMPEGVDPRTKMYNWLNRPLKKE